MRTVAVTGAKGGTGKTATAINLAACFASLGLVSELRDLDPQASATLALGITPAADPWSADPLPLVHPRLARGFVLRPAGRSLGLVERGQRPVAALIEPQTRWRPDVLIYDCPPALGPLTLAALDVADLALVPVEAAPIALPGLADIAALGEGRERAFMLRAVLTRVQQRRVLTGDVRRRIEEQYPGVLARAEIPEDVKVAEAPGFGLPVALYAPECRASAGYRALASELLPLLHRAERARRGATAVFET